MSPLGLLLIAWLVLGAAVPSGRAQVSIDIGIHLPAPPRLVIVPHMPAVQYEPTLPANLFVYGGQYWLFTPGGWHVSAGYNGPWLVVAPPIVPRPLLRVPVQYYRVPPGHWKPWPHHAPPRWGDEWGRPWAQQRGWKDRGHDHHPGRKGTPEKGHDGTHRRRDRP